MKHTTPTSLFAAVLLTGLAVSSLAEGAGGRRPRAVSTRRAPAVLAEGRPVVSAPSGVDHVGTGAGAGGGDVLIPSGGVATRGHGDGTPYFGWTQTWEDDDRPLAAPSLRPAR